MKLAEPDFTYPEGGRRPMIERAETDFPHPLSPTMHKVSPFFKENEISSTAVTFPVLVRKQVVKLLTSN